MWARRIAMVVAAVATLVAAASPAIVTAAAPTSNAVGAAALSAVPLDRAPAPPWVEQFEPPEIPAPPPPDEIALPDGAAEALPPVPDDAVAIPPPPEELDGPRRATPSSLPPQLREEPGPPEGGVFAVVIGIDDYPGTSADLFHAGADAEAFDAALDQFGVDVDRRLVLRDADADRETIIAALDWLTVRAGPDATAVFFFAGHVRSLGGGTEAILAADGELLTDEEVALHLGPLAARQTWIVLAACYGGGFTEVLAPGRILTAAASADALAYENRKLGASYLVHYLVREGWLEGRAGGSVQEAYAYAYHRIADRYPDRLPEQYDWLGEPLVLGDAATRAPAPAPAERIQPAPAPQAPAPSQRPRPTPTTAAPPAPAEQQDRHPPRNGGQRGRTCIGGVVCRGNP